MLLFPLQEIWNKIIINSMSLPHYFVHFKQNCLKAASLHRFLKGQKWLKYITNTSIWMKYIVYLSQRQNRTYPYILKNWPKPGHSSHLRKIPLSLRTVQSRQFIPSRSIIQLSVAKSKPKKPHIHIFNPTSQQDID